MADQAPPRCQVVVLRLPQLGSQLVWWDVDLAELMYIFTPFCVKNYCFSCLKYEKYSFNKLLISFLEAKLDFCNIKILKYIIQISAAQHSQLVPAQALQLLAPPTTRLTQCFLDHQTAKAEQKQNLILEDISQILVLNFYELLGSDKLEQDITIASVPPTALPAPKT